MNDPLDATTVTGTFAEHCVDVELAAMRCLVDEANAINAQWRAVRGKLRGTADDWDIWVDFKAENDAPGNIILRQEVARRLAKLTRKMNDREALLLSLTALQILRSRPKVPGCPNE